MQLKIGKPIDGSDSLLEARAIAEGLSYPVTAVLTNLMPHHATLGGVYLPVEGSEEMTVNDGDTLLRFVSDAQQVAELGGYDVAVTVDLPEPKAEETKPETAEETKPETKAKAKEPPVAASKEGA